MAATTHRCSCFVHEKQEIAREIECSMERAAGSPLSSQITELRKKFIDLLSTENEIASVAVQIARREVERSAASPGPAPRVPQRHADDIDSARERELARREAQVKAETERVTREREAARRERDDIRARQDEAVKTRSLISEMRESIKADMHLAVVRELDDRQREMEERSAARVEAMGQEIALLRSSLEISRRAQQQAEVESQRERNHLEEERRRCVDLQAQIDRLHNSLAAAPLDLETAVADALEQKAYEIQQLTDRVRDTQQALERVTQDADERQAHESHARQEAERRVREAERRAHESERRVQELETATVAAANSSAAAIAAAKARTPSAVSEVDRRALSEADRRVTEAERRMKEAERRSSELEKRLQDSGRKSSEAEQRARDTSSRVASLEASLRDATLHRGAQAAAAERVRALEAEIKTRAEQVHPPPGYISADELEQRIQEERESLEESFVGQKAALERKFHDTVRQKDKEAEELRARVRAAEEKVAQPVSPSKIALSEEQKHLENTLRARVRDLEQAAQQRQDAQASSAAELERVQRRLKSLESKLIEKEEELREARLATTIPPSPVRTNGSGVVLNGRDTSAGERQLKEMHVAAIATYDAKREALTERRRTVQAELTALAAPLSSVQ